MLALITGGRTINERPNECYIKQAVDADIMSAYGSALVNLKMPVGKPRLISTSPNEDKQQTLAKFMRFTGKDLLKGNYIFVLDGELNFPQDLIFSRPENLVKQARLAANFDPGDPNSYNPRYPTPKPLQPKA